MAPSYGVLMCELVFVHSTSGYVVVHVNACTSHTSLRIRGGGVPVIVPAQQSDVRPREKAHTVHSSSHNTRRRNFVVGHTAKLCYDVRETCERDFRCMLQVPFPLNTHSLQSLVLIFISNYIEFVPV